MENAFAGQATLCVNGTKHRCKLTLGALAELESSLQSGSLMDLIARFESGGFSAADILAVLHAGLRGGGDWAGTADDLVAADIAGGPIHGAQVAAQLLTRAFAPMADDG